MTYGSLFAGIGGFDLGFDLAGLKCRWQVEKDPYCQRVLRKHWPNVGQWDDVRTFPPAPAEDWRVDVICGGFPCQDISQAGKMAGIRGEKSGLFFEFMRIVRTLRPRFVVLENVAALLVESMGDVLGELAASGYDAEWDCLPCSSFGGPHVRDRVFVVAYPNGFMESSRLRIFSNWEGPVSPEEYRKCSETLAWNMAAGERVSGMDDGVSFGVDRRRSLGNAVVPQIAEWIGRRLLDTNSSTSHNSKP